MAQTRHTVAGKAIAASLNVRVLLLILWLAYTAKTVEPAKAAEGVVIATWLVLSIFAVRDLGKRVAHYALTVSLCLLASFLVGWIVAKCNLEDLFVARTLLTHTVLLLLVSVALHEMQRASDAQSGHGGPGMLDVVSWLIIAGGVAFVAYGQRDTDYLVNALLGEGYLTVSDLLCMLALASMSRPGCGRFVKYIWALIAVTGLMLLGSRAAMILFGVSAVIAFTFGGRGRRSLDLIGSVSAIAVLSAAVFAFFQYFEESLTYRVLSVINLAGDASMDARLRFLWVFLERLDDDLVCLVLPCFPEVGKYVHNILSVHEYFGAIGVSVLVAVAVVLAAALVRGWRPPMMALFVYCVLQLGLARSWVSVVFPVFLAYGVIAATYLEPLSVRRWHGQKIAAE